MKNPLHITGYTLAEGDVVVVTLLQGDCSGRGEAAGVYYRAESSRSMIEQVEAIRSAIEIGIDREALRQVLPPGGARNAVDCAMWELEAKLAGRSVWQLAGLPEPRPLLTTFTIGASEPATMADSARTYRQARAIKLKLTGETVDATRVQAVRAARPDVWLAVDANQGFTPRSLERIMPVLADARVALIEQPFAVGDERLLDGLRLPIPIAADESVQCLADMERLAGLFDYVNIKLDKCGGLTEGLAMARAAGVHGSRPMVGCMVGTSLAMAPAFLLGQVCHVVDLDAPTFLAADRDPPADYSEGLLAYPRPLWGDGSTNAVIARAQ